MAMFDDPNKELQRLQNELLAEEELDDDLEGIDELLEDYEEEGFDDCFEEAAEEDDAFRRPNSPKDFTRSMSEILLEENADADRAFYDDDFQTAKKKKNKGITGLVILCVLETLAIVGLLAWWYLCLR